MGCCKGLLGKFLFVFTYAIVFLHLYAVSIISVEKKDRYCLEIFKNILYFFSIVSMVCHLRASFTEPGMVRTPEENLNYLDFYYKLRSQAVRRANIFNIKHKQMLRPPPNFEDEENSDLSDWENDSTIYTDPQIFSEEKIKKISEELFIDMVKCKKCYIARVPGVKHCSFCKSCVFNMDHHCPWVNNCIGQYNKKFFIQFCVYSMISTALSTFITVYYALIKNPTRFMESFVIGLVLVTQLVFSICLTILNGRLLLDQYELAEEQENSKIFYKTRLRY
jgi:hypothetical protein